MGSRVTDVCGKKTDLLVYLIAPNDARTEFRRTSILQKQSDAFPPSEKINHVLSTLSNESSTWASSLGEAGWCVHTSSCGSSSLGEGGVRST
jgi:hypothetical protein